MLDQSSAVSVQLIYMDFKFQEQRVSVSNTGLKYTLATIKYCTTNTEMIVKFHQRYSHPALAVPRNLFLCPDGPTATEKDEKGQNL